MVNEACNTSLHMLGGGKHASTLPATHNVSFHFTKSKRSACRLHTNSLL